MSFISQGIDQSLREPLQRFATILGIALDHFGSLMSAPAVTKTHHTNWLVVWLPFFIFPYIGNFIIPIDFHIFQRGKPTTNQQNILMCPHVWLMTWERKASQVYIFLSGAVLLLGCCSKPFGLMGRRWKSISTCWLLQNQQGKSYLRFSIASQRFGSPPQWWKILARPPSNWGRIAMSWTSSQQVPVISWAIGIITHGHPSERGCSFFMPMLTMLLVT